jgi:hypothetical protein
MTHRKASRLLVEQLEDRLTPSTNEIPAGQFNWTQFSPNGTLSQLLWSGQTLVYQTWNGTAWQSQNVATSTSFTEPTYTSRDEMMTASQTAQLVYTTNGTPNALFLEKQWNGQLDGWQTLIRDYVQTASGWKLATTLTPPGLNLWGPNNLVAVAGPHNSISLLYTETTVAAGNVGQFGSGTLWYATNQSGNWTYSQIATTADLNADIWIEGTRYAPRFLSLAVTPSGSAYVTYTPEFYVSGAFGTIDSTLMFATNASGSWQSQTVVAPLNGAPGDAGLGASVAVAPDGQVAVASYYVERFATGSAEASWLMYSTLNANGSWTSTTAVSTPDGYVAGDGAHYTGFAPELSFNAQSQPTIVFSDEAAQHLLVSYENEFSGQIRTTTLVNGSWVTATVLPQSNPLVNQLFYPVAVTFNGETVYAGVEATSTLDSNDNPTSMSFSLSDVIVPAATTSPPVSPPPVVVSPPPVSPPVIVSSPPVSPPPVSPPPVVVSPPPVSPVVVSPPPVSPPVVVSPPPVSPPPVKPVLVTATAAGTTTVVRVTYSNGTSYSWDPFGSTYTAGASVALGDVTGDGIPDIVVASGVTGTSMGGTVQIYNGATRKLIASFTPLGGFGGGLDVAVGDVNGDGHADIVVGVMGGGWPVVTVINGATGKVMDQFLAYSTSFGGGVRVGVGDVNDDGYADVVVGPGADANGQLVKVYSGKSILTGTGTPQLLGTLNPFPNYTGAVSVAVGNLTSGGYADIVVGSQSYSDLFKVYSGASLSVSSPPAPLFTQTAWATVDTTGIKVALVSNAAGNGLDDLIVTNGTGSKTARYLDSQFTTSGWPTTDAEFFTAIPGINSPIFVG